MYRNGFLKDAGSKYGELRLAAAEGVISQRLHGDTGGWIPPA